MIYIYMFAQLENLKQTGSQAIPSPKSPFKLMLISECISFQNIPTFTYMARIRIGILECFVQLRLAEMVSQMQAPIVI